MFLIREKQLTSGTNVTFLPTLECFIFWIHNNDKISVKNITAKKIAIRTEINRVDC